MKKSFAFLMVGAVGILGLSSCARQPFWDTPFSPGEFETTLEVKSSNETDGAATYEVTYQAESAGGVMTISRGYNHDEPVYGFILPRRISGFIKEYKVREDNSDHSLQLKDLTRVTVDVKYEVKTDRKAPTQQTANFLLDTAGARQQVGGAQIFRLDFGQAWQTACDDEMSAAVRRSFAGITNYNQLRELWSNTDPSTSQSKLDVMIANVVNKALVGSTNCSLRVSALTVSNIAPDAATQDALAKISQTQQRVAAVKELVAEFNRLGLTGDNRKLAEALLLSGSAKEFNIHTP
jgi:hypothetical protein